MTEPAALQAIDENIWIMDGEVVSFYGFPYPTRMTVIRLEGGKLLIHSPIGPDAIDAVLPLGEIAYIVSPNKIHHLFMKDWGDRFPKAKLYASPGLPKKRKDIRFHDTLTDKTPDGWAREVDQAVLKGSFAMEEVAFFHKASRTMIVADMIERLEGEGWSWWAKLIGRMDGLMGPNGAMPKEWRASFINRKKARASVARMLAWQPDRIIIAHGPCVMEDGTAYLKQSFHWLLKSE